MRPLYHFFLLAFLNHVVLIFFLIIVTDRIYNFFMQFFCLVSVARWRLELAIKFFFSLKVSFLIALMVGLDLTEWCAFRNRLAAKPIFVATREVGLTALVVLLFFLRKDFALERINTLCGVAQATAQLALLEEALELSVESSQIGLVQLV